MELSKRSNAKLEEANEEELRQNKAIGKLRVVHTQVILFLQSMSERDGSDMERLRNLMM